MKSSAAVTAIFILVAGTITTAAQTTVYDPSPTDPRVVEALAARKHLGEVMRAVDIVGVEALMAPDTLVMLKRGGQWRITASQNTSAPHQAPALVDAKSLIETT